MVVPLVDEADEAAISGLVVELSIAGPRRSATCDDRRTMLPGELSFQTLSSLRHRELSSPHVNVLFSPWSAQGVIAMPVFGLSTRSDIVSPTLNHKPSRVLPHLSCKIPRKHRCPKSRPCNSLY